MVNCPICFEEASNPHYTVPCINTFCFHCITAWGSETCPLCRETVVDVDYVLYQMSFNFWKLMCIYDGIKSWIFLQNSWNSLFQNTVHLLLLFLLACDSVWIYTDGTKCFQTYPPKTYFPIEKVVQRMRLSLYTGER